MLKCLYKFLKNKSNIYRNRSKNVRFLDGCRIDSQCNFEGYNSIGENNSLKNCQLGIGTYTGHDVNLTSVKIGRFCSIASNINNIVGHHPTSGFISTHPSFFSIGKAAGFTFSKKQLFTEMRYVTDNFLVVIGNDVWIGDRVTILDGVKIGDGAIIGANSLVTKDINPYTINVGIPAKPIKKRFTDDQITFLLKFKWWNKDWQWIKMNSHLFNEIELFIKENK